MTVEAVRERITDRIVLLAISSGLIWIIMGILVGIFTSPRALPNWAENVLVSIGTAAILKLGDCLSVLVSLSTGKTTERLSTQLAQTAPVEAPSPPPGPTEVTVVNPPSDPVQTQDAGDKL